LLIPRLLPRFIPLLSVGYSSPQLLEDGIRAELVRQLTTAMHTFLVFKTGQLGEFEARLAELGRKLDGFRQSFEYIQGQQTST